MDFETHSLVLILAVALAFWTIGRRYEELRERAARQNRIAACLEAAPDDSPLAPVAQSDAPALRAGGIAADLRGLEAMDGSFDAARFLEGARLVYEAIVLAFAKGDRELLADLVSAEVYRTFVQSIAMREARRRHVSLRFVCIRHGAIEQATVVGGRAQIVVGFDSEIVTVTRDAANAVVAGDPGAIVTVADRWTFEKEIRSNGIWKLAATESPGAVPGDIHATENAAACG